MINARWARVLMMFWWGNLGFGVFIMLESLAASVGWNLDDTGARYTQSAILHHLGKAGIHFGVCWIIKDSLRRFGA